MFYNGRLHWLLSWNRWCGIRWSWTRDVDDSIRYYSTFGSVPLAVPQADTSSRNQEIDLYCFDWNPFWLGEPKFLNPQRCTKTNVPCTVANSSWVKIKLGNMFTGVWNPYDKYTNLIIAHNLVQEARTICFRHDNTTPRASGSNLIQNHLDMDLSPPVYSSYTYWKAIIIELLQ